MTSLRTLHLEISSKCALSCHACPRTEFKGTYAVKDLSLAAIKNITNTKDEYDTVVLCGDHGDPIYHSQFIEVVKLIKQMKNQPYVDIYTNGSGRGKEWWLQLAEVLEEKDFVRFAIDGLEDTNHLYRKGAKWDSIMTGIHVLNEHSVCKKLWHWILFRYNQHQVREGLMLAKELSFNRFTIVESFRHSDPYEDEMYKPTLSLEEARSLCED